MYYYFQKILDWVREVLARMLPKIGKEDSGSLLNLNIILTPRIAWALQQWSLMYINLAPWTTKDDMITPNGVKSLNIPAAVSAELARTTTIDMTCSITGSARAVFLNETMQKLIGDIRPFVEYGCAKGSLIFKPYVKDEDTDHPSIAIDYVQADMFYPMAFDSDRRLTSCCFVDMKQVGGHFYKRFEYHILEAEGEHVYNWNFKSTARDDMGDRCSLDEVPEWADIEEEAMIEDVEKPLYAYFRMPFANNIDPLSPVGVSCFARACDLIEETDKLWNDFLWEFDSGQRALYVDSMAFGKDKRTGNPVLPKERLYRTLDMGGMDDAFFNDWTPSLREMSYINALEAHDRVSVRP
jgi:A118 family predicted phage portal protein